MKVHVIAIDAGDKFHESVGVFTEDHRLEAVKAAELIGGVVEDFELNVLEFNDPGMDFFAVSAGLFGEVMVVRRGGRLQYDGNKHEQYCKVRVKRGIWCIFWAGYAESEEHARRHVEELRRQILAGQRPAEVDFGKK